MVGVGRKSRDIQAKALDAWFTRTLKEGQKHDENQLSSALFGWPDGRPSHRWCSVDSGRGRCRLIRMILMERADELPKVLNCR